MVKDVKILPHFIPTGVAIGLLGLGGCGCATPQSRAQEKSEAFASLPKKFQEAALKGELVEGMNADAVYIALGKPERVVSGEEKGVQQERWVYVRIETDEVPAWRETYGRTADGRVLAFRQYDPIRLTRFRDSFEVKFEKGKAVGWRGL